MSRDLSNDLYNRIVQKVINEWGYKESSISFNFLDTDDIAIFYENKPHLEENLFAIINIGLNTSFFSNVEIIKKNRFNNQNSFKLKENQSRYKYCTYIVLMSLERDLTWEREGKDNYVPAIFPISYNKFSPKSLKDLIRNYDLDLLINKSFIKRNSNLILGIFFIKCIDEHENMHLYITPDEIKAIQSNDEKYNHTKSKCLSRIYSLIDSMVERYEFINRNYSYDLNNPDRLTTLLRAVSMLQNYRISDLIKNFEEIRSKYFSNTSTTEERITPSIISELIPNMLNPKKTDKIIDPKLSDTSYLLKIAQFLGKTNNTIIGWDENSLSLSYFKYLAEIEIKNFYPEIDYRNFVFENKGINEFEKMSDFSNDFNNYDIVVYKLLITNKYVIKNNIEGFDLGYKWVEKNGVYEKAEYLNGQMLEILYLELSIKLLKPKGKMALVLPEGILQKPSLRYVREYILKQCKVLAIISTSISSISLLILEKYSKDENISDYDIFFSNLKTDINVPEQFDLFNQGKELKPSNNIFIKKYSELENRLDYGYYVKDYNYTSDENFKPLYGFVEILAKKSSILKDKNSSDIIVKYIELSDVDTRTSQIISHKDVKVSEIPKRAYFQLEEGDIILSTSGHNLGTTEHPIIYVTEFYNGAVCSSNFRVLRPRKNLINTFYLLAFLKTKHFRNQIYKNLHGSVTPTISDDSLKQILIYYPDKEVQEHIGNKYLSSYMSLLENIKSMDDTLEELNDIII